MSEANHRQVDRPDPSLVNAEKGLVDIMKGATNEAVLSNVRKLVNSDVLSRLPLDEK